LAHVRVCHEIMGEAQADGAHGIEPVQI
jgi:hypothetical protein